MNGDCPTCLTLGHPCDACRAQAESDAMIEETERIAEEQAGEGDDGPAGM